LPDLHIALCPSSRHIKEHATGDNPVKPDIQCTPLGSAKTNIVVEAPAVIQIALILHMTESIHVGYGDPVIDQTYIVYRGFGIAASDRAEHVVV
jgi:hypothetical protein